MATTPEQPQPEPQSDAGEIGYREALVELESILTELEEDTIDIDVLSQRVERAATLITVCRGRIASAENRVNEIVAQFQDDSDST